MDILSFMFTFPLRHQINRPTRYQKESGPSMLIKYSQMSQIVQTSKPIFIHDISDHCPILVLLWSPSIADDDDFLFNIENGT